MLKLSRAMTKWSPSDRSGGLEPLGLLAAAWSDIVGPQVAENSAPTRLRGDTLVVTSRSSSWAAQLSFLADRVLGAVAARVPSAGIARLAFRTGALPKRSAAPRRIHTAAPPRGRIESEPSATAADALTRFARHVHDAHRGRREAGWMQCASCRAFVAPASPQLCARCATAAEQARALATARLVFEAPWLGAAATAALVPGSCDLEYERIRSRLLKSWRRMLEQAVAAGRLSRDGRERQVASSYVVLQSRIAPEAITPATVRNVLGDQLHDLLYGGGGSRFTPDARKRGDRKD